VANWQGGRLAAQPVIWLATYLMSDPSPPPSPAPYLPPPRPLHSCPGSDTPSLLHSPSPLPSCSPNMARATSPEKHASQACWKLQKTTQKSLAPERME
jgi:hypothetical protein